jgi:hypothetical protein
MGRAPHSMNIGRAKGSCSRHLLHFLSETYLWKPTAGEEMAVQAMTDVVLKRLNVSGFEGTG